MFSVCDEVPNWGLGPNWDQTDSLIGPKKVPILLSSPKFHFDVFLDRYLIWKKVYFDLSLKYIDIESIYIMHSLAVMKRRSF